MPSRLSWLCGAFCLVLELTGCDGKLTGKGSPTTPTTQSPSDPDDVPITPWEQESAPVYLAKVKNLLTGLPPTASELASVQSNPAALKGMIDGWGATPQAQAKLLTFFTQAFQQTQIGTNDLVDQIGGGNGLEGNGTAITALLGNIKESVARTALGWSNSGRPLNEAPRTRKLQMTTALMAFLAMVDARGVSDTGGVRDRYYYLSGPADPTVGFVATLNGTQSSIDPQNLKNQVWVVQPSPATATSFAGCDSATYGSKGTSRQLLPKNDFARQLFNLLLGRVPDDPSFTGGGTLPCRAFTTTALFQSSDFTDWREVTMRQPASGEDPTRFWNLSALRGSSELVLRVARAGFLSTPAFFANWQTNSSNQNRVTMNQTLIVALGKSFDGTGSTVPISETGLDEEHASDPACYACHQTLDPMRQYFRQSYTLQYGQQTDAGVVAQYGEFAFDGVTASGTAKGIFDLADLLATHPRFATAWTQKVCTWADSAPCSEDDPEFQRIASAFQTSGHDFRTLLREMLSSPLVTGTASTKTFADRGVIVSVARYDHLCTALSNRLGLANACKVNGTATSLSGTLPADAYSRGAESPVLTADTSLFFRSITENLCRTVADQVVDAGTTPRYSSKDPTGAVNDMVRTVMALVDGDPRQAGATTILNEHYAAALTTGAKATDALKSTFVLACSSPTAVAIGL